MADLHELIWEREWRRCFPEWAESTPEELRDAFSYFCATYWYIQTPHGRQLFELFNEQQDAVYTFLTSRKVVALKARQIGFSTVVAAYAFWCAYGYGDRRILMLSKGEREAAELLSKSTYGWRSLPEWMRLKGPVTNANQQKMVLGDSTIESLPSGKNPARGMTAWLAIIDEFAFLDYPKEAWASVEPVVDVGGRLITLSTANGEGNIFHDTWVRATAGTNGFTPIFYPWWSRSDRSQDWYEAKKRELPPWQLAQEYPSNPDEAFLRSGNPFFDVDGLREIEPIQPKRGFLVLDETVGLTFEEDPVGPLRLWIDEPSRTGVYVIGADVAEGLEHGDFSSAHVIDARTGEVVAHWHGHIDPDLFGSDVLYPLHVWFNEALTAPEVNNHGLTTVKALQRAGCSNLFRQRRYGSRTEDTTDQIGWRTTASTKPYAVDQLARALREGSIRLVDSETIAELRTFVREGNGKLHGSPHDDRVMSLAIANQMLAHAWLPQFRKKIEHEPGTAGWWMNKFFPKKREKRVPIGANAVRM